MTKRLLILLSLMTSLLLVSSPVALAAQDPDVEEIADTVSAADPRDLLDALVTPPRDRALPDGFTKATYVDIADAGEIEDSGSDCLYDASGLIDAEGAAAYTLKTNVKTLDYLYACASLDYIVYDEDVLGDTPLEDFKEGVAQGLGDDDFGTPDASGGVPTMDDIEVAGEDAVVVTYSLAQDGAYVVVQQVAIPVGNTFLIAVLSVADDREIDQDDLLEVATALAVSGIEHLGNVAEDL